MFAQPPYQAGPQRRCGLCGGAVRLTTYSGEKDHRGTVFLCARCDLSPAPIPRPPYTKGEE